MPKYSGSATDEVRRLVTDRDSYPSMRRQRKEHRKYNGREYTFDGLNLHYAGPRKTGLKKRKGKKK